MTALNKKQSYNFYLTLIIGAIIGAAAFFAINTYKPLVFTNDEWILGGYVEKDIIQHYTGWLFYRQSDWAFPFGIAKNMNIPFGTSVAFTDSIPLFAVLFKLLSPILPDTFQYFGLFNFLCYILQGVSSALLLTLFTDDKIKNALGTMLFVLSPVMIERAFRHTALTAHFFILFALYFYFKSRRENKIYILQFSVLNLLAVSIHPYFVPMLYAVLFALLLEYSIKNKVFLKPALVLAGNMAATLFVMYILGMLSSGSEGGSLGYGYFCMNLNALFNPTSCSDIVWSQILPVQNQVLGNYESFNYLGVGILAAAAGCVIYMAVNYKKAVNIIKNHYGLLFVCGCLTAFAISTTVTANGRTLLSFELPLPLLKLCTVFRSSGRMFWPVYYLIILTSLYVIFKLGKRLGYALLCACLAVQIFDIYPALKTKHSFFANNETAFESLMTHRVWQDLKGKYDTMFSFNGVVEQGLYPALYTAQNGMNTNQAFAARYDIKQQQQISEKVQQDIKNGILDEKTLYITSEVDTFASLAPYVIGKALCARVDGYWYIIAPGAVNNYEQQESFLNYENLPLTIVDYSDDNWLHGVLMWDNKTVAFYDNPLTQKYLENAGFIICDGIEYEIVKQDKKDAGWNMVTLNIDDASVLVGKQLKTR